MRTSSQLAIKLAGLASMLAMTSTVLAQETLRFGMAARDVSSLDPALTTGNVDEFIVRQMFNTLVAPPMGTLDINLDEIEGELAKSWEISKDSQTWTFQLRQGVHWHGGYGEVTAEDVKFTFDRLRDPEVGSPYINSFEIIDEVEIVDDYTVTFHLKQPSAYFHATSLLPRFGPYIVPKAAVEELGEDFRTNPIGSGPFEFVGYDPGERVQTRAFDDYFRDRPAIDEVHFLLVPETSARTLAFFGNELDIIEGARSPGWLQDMERQKPDSIFDTLQPGSIQNVFLNMTIEPLDDRRVRQAIAHGLNKEVWQQAYGILAGPLWGPAPEDFYGGLAEEDVPEELRYDFDPERARALLAEAGHPDGFTIEAFISEREDYQSNMLMIQDQLSQIGININLRVVDHTSYHNDINEGRNTIIPYSTSQPPIVVPILEAFYHSDSIITKPTRNRNFSRYGDISGNIDEALNEAIAETDPERQLEKFRDIQLEIMRELPVVPIQTLAMFWVRQPWVELGFVPQAGLGHYQLEKAHLNR
nr:ABC transporter substrate-binding protein [Halomonas socia]